jgi:2-keto-4-pentenoate hydratase/2-oxohepta-3-ene-1,7-dioic acid hydratase in catechol pathway
MRIVRYEHQASPRLGLLDGEQIWPLPDSHASVPAHEMATGPAPAQGEAVTLQEVHLLAPVRPPKIVAVGLNYRDHAEEQGTPLPDAPLLFAKFPTAVTGPFDDIEKPVETSQLDYEAELGVVIGAPARRVRAADAVGHVAGYLVVNDVSARDAQFADGQWVRGKSFDTFAPLGPALATPDEVPDPHALDIRTWVNGELRQSSNTGQLIFPIPDLIEYCSRYFTLEPGDIICTGTPAGVGVFSDPPRFLEVGDVVEVEVERVGRLRNRVVGCP